jgi:methionyl-tRNA formyltransferase
MKVVFMGTPEFSVPTLNKLIKNHEVVAVVTQPDRASGRGKKVAFSPVKEVAIKNKIKVLQPEKMRDEIFLKELESCKADIFVVAAYGKILPEEILNMPKHKCINVHGSLLPKYRGAGPIQWAVINGEKITGITIMYMAKGMDTGDMILKKEIPILDTDTTKTMYEKMAVLGADALIEAVDLIDKGNVVAVAQDDTKATLAPMLKKEMGLINFNKTSREIFNQIRGMNPWPGSYTHYKGEMLKIWSVDIIETNNKEKPGTVIDILDKEKIVVATKDKAIAIKELQVMGGKRLQSSEFLKGNKIEIGESFG